MVNAEENADEIVTRLVAADYLVDDWLADAAASGSRGDGGANANGDGEEEEEWWIG